MVFCIIREPAAFSQEANGRIKFFHPAGRHQYVVEGLIIGGYDLVAAICIILLSQWAIFLKNPSARYIALSVCLAGFALAYKSMVAAYSFKNRWYQTWF